MSSEHIFGGFSSRSGLGSTGEGFSGRSGLGSTGEGLSGRSVLGGSRDVPRINDIGIVSIISRGLEYFLRGFGGGDGSGKSGGGPLGSAQVLEMTMEDSEGETEQYA